MTATPGDAGVGEAAIDVAEAVQRTAKGGLDRRFVTDIAFQRQYLLSGDAQGFHRGGVLRRVGSPDGDIGTGLRHRQGHTQAYAAVAAGDQSDLARQIEWSIRHGVTSCLYPKFRVAVPGGGRKVGIPTVRCYRQSPKETTS